MTIWYPFLTLMADAMLVIEMRLRLFALGKGTPDEMFLMVSEKIEGTAGIAPEAARPLDGGGIRKGRIDSDLMR
jgi:hypothetical protein